MLAMTDNRMIEESPARTIDARGLACPLPVLRLGKVLAAAASGTIVELLATDRTVGRDVPAFCDAAGHKLLGVSEEGGTLRFLVRRA